MPDSKITDLTENTTPQPTDLLVIEDDPGGAPSTQKIKVSNLFKVSPIAFKNAIINGDMQIAQRGTSFTSTTTPANNDDAYVLDRWYILSDGNDVADVTRATDAPANRLYSIGLDVETINKKFGIAQIVEQQNCIGLIGETASLSFKARVSSTTKLDNIKAAVVAWSGTADVVTSDIVSAWGVEGTNPTLIANATYENSPANLNVTTAWATYRIENISIDTSNAKNIIVFIWSDVTDTTLGDFLYITDVQLEQGAAATNFERLPVDIDLARCQRYYYRLSPAAANVQVSVGFNVSTTEARGVTYFPVSLRSAPTALEQTGTAANYEVNHAATATACSAAPTFQSATSYSAITTFTVASGLTAGQGSFGRTASTAAYLGWNAEL